MDDLVNAPLPSVLYDVRKPYCLVCLGDNVVARALGIIFQSLRIESIAFPSEEKDATTALATHRADLNRVFANGSPHGVIACSEGAWRAARLLNVWDRHPSIFEQDDDDDDDVTARQPWAAPMVSFSGPLPSDYLAAPISGIEPSLIALMGWLAKLDVDRTIERRLLEKTFLHYYMANARHDLLRFVRSGETNPHALNDHLAAIRLIQGAALEGRISRGAALDACRRVLRVPVNGQVVPLDPERLIPGAINASPRAIDAPDSSKLTMLVVDDRGLWGEPLQPIWTCLGLNLTTRTNTMDAVAAARAKEYPGFRAVLLDVWLGDRRYGGVEALLRFQVEKQRLPVIALSVDDYFSEAVTLKRLGAFAYLNKHMLSEPTRGRDAVSAFRMLDESLRIGCFAALTSDLDSLWKTLEAVMLELLKAEERTGRFSSPIGATPDDVRKRLRTLGERIEASLCVVWGETARWFHGFWQDQRHPTGLASRQVIRSFGIANDQWCSAWEAWRFDADDREAARSWQMNWSICYPNWFLHEVVKGIRGEASHSMVADRAFHWVDMWIVAIAVLLKIDGTTRAHVRRAVTHRVLPRQGAEERIAAIERLWAEFVSTLTVLLGSSEVRLGPPSVSVRVSESLAVERASELRDAIERWLPIDTSVDFPEGDDRRVSVQPYLCKVGSRGQIMVRDLAERAPAWVRDTKCCLPACVLVLELMLNRLRQAAAEQG